MPEVAVAEGMAGGGVVSRTVGSAGVVCLVGVT